MNSEVPSPPPPGLKLDDIYYILFRHKWKIIAFTAAGFAAAASIFFGTAPVYKSEAKLLIRYVLESKGVNPVGADDTVKSPDSRGDNIINSELEIINSMDLAKQVVDLVGPEKILAKVGGGNNRALATAVVKKGLVPDVPRKSNIIRLTFSHPDPEVVQPVLERLVEVYRRKHIEIHRGIGVVDDFLSQQTDQLRARLSQTENDLRAAKAQADVISLDDSKRAFIEQLTKLRQDLFAAEAEFEEHKAAVNLLPKSIETGPKTNATEQPVPADITAAYRDIVAQFHSVSTNRLALLARYREESPMVKQVQEELIRLEQRKKELEEQHPSLLAIAPAALAVSSAGIDIAAETARIRGLAARIGVLTNQLARVRAEMLRVDQAEARIVQLQRQKELEETNFKFYSANLEQARADEALGVGRITNIGIAQAPSPAIRDTSKIMKPAAGAAVGALGFGLGLAFLLELVLNHAVRRPGEIESRFHLSLFLTIPDFSPKRSRLFARFRRLPLLKKFLPIPPPSTLNLRSVGNSPQLAEPLSTIYSDALRDRLMTWFDVRNLTHKPKLVAVTSCSASAGVSTIATALAASLSETGSGKVLLVDMDHDRAAAHPFFDGKPACALHDAFDEQKPEAALAHQNLYIASGNGVPDGLPKAMPKRFSHLMPKMKASDYDYIIFDMPPINQTSVTPRLANFMDMVLIVVETEKTTRAAVKRGLAALAESKSPVAAVLNKTHSYIPSWLQHDDV
jgi:succinoglycan biosynthesis transport protein ExoP